MTFRTPYGPRPAPARIEPFQEVQDVIEMFYDVNGEMTFEKTGEVKIRERINSYADSCDLRRILQMYSATQDRALLERDGGRAQYADVTGLPDNRNDLTAMADHIRETLVSDDELRRSFFDRILGTTQKPIRQTASNVAADPTLSEVSSNG